MIKRDLAYFERRAREEREATANASSVEAAAVHRRFAETYDEKVRRIRTRLASCVGKGEASQRSGEHPILTPRPKLSTRH